MSEDMKSLFTYMGFMLAILLAFYGVIGYGNYQEAQVRIACVQAGNTPENCVVLVE